MKPYYFTFGQRYRRERHPQGGHSDGYFTVLAPDWESANKKMFEICGDKWSMQYSEQPSIETFPRGNLKTIQA